MSRGKYEESAISRYDILINEFINLAINRFNWTNLPIGLTSEILEGMLIRYGQVIAHKNSIGGIYILPCSGVNDINVYGIPELYNVISLNGLYNEQISLDDGILIKNNPLASENITNLEIFAKRIDDIEMTQDVNLFQQNIPKIILSDEGGKLTAKNLIQKIKEFKLVIFAKKNLTKSISQSDVLDTTSPYLLDKLQRHKTEIYNELLTSLGINNNNNQKKERMIVDEVNANNDFISINIDLMYDLRKKACDDINKKFGLDIKVEKREVQLNGDLYTNNKATGGE